MGAWNEKDRSPMVLVGGLGLVRVLFSVEERSCLVGMYGSKSSER